MILVPDGMGWGGLKQPWVNQLLLLLQGKALLEGPFITSASITSVLRMCVRVHYYSIHTLTRTVWYV